MTIENTEKATGEKCDGPILIYSCERLNNRASI